ncbi:hypothetical protein EVAR_46891_1 [Eumeta japonica]|uniref:Uncharacterized protein n=1 Tax=Eumeta variegata TaxID=151549 RepID=A0A4C1YBP3_EUMVA|nr:hypothetical protein EVAR_46891_1 [Eumeta japonica]
MKEPYPEEIMLCFVQGFGNGSERTNDRDYTDTYTLNNNNGQIPKKKSRQKRVSLQIDESDNESVEFRSSKKSSVLVTGKSLRLSTSGDGFLKRFPEVKRSFSDRFSTIAEPSGKNISRGLLTIRKTRVSAGERKSEQKSFINDCGSAGAAAAGYHVGGATHMTNSHHTPTQILPPEITG